MYYLQNFFYCFICPILVYSTFNSKNTILEKYHDIVRNNNQPLLCTYLEGEVVPNDDNIVLYSPRSELSGSVICHFGEIHTNILNINDRITIKF